MPASTRKETLPFSVEDILQAVMNTVKRLKWIVVGANLKSGVIEARTGTSFKSWCENVSIRIFPESPGSSLVVTSKSANGFYAWGKNSDNLNDLFAQFTFDVLKLHLAS